MSDSDYSDTETGQATRIRDTEARVRQAAHSLLLSTIKVRSLQSNCLYIVCAVL
uniref:Uncharacterized protein n=1 Tax=Timema shepardi TaxID=629360 RepID=A0A7R9BDW3_TIMSH|nr:unnamed protein product [Timema shepardi]